MTIYVGVQKDDAIAPETSEPHFTARKRSSAELCLPSEDVLSSAVLHCQKGGELKTVRECWECAHFLESSTAGGEVQVTCQWSDADPVLDLMTRADALIAIAPETSVNDADRLARQHRIRHLIVARADELLGIVCRCDLVAGSAAPVSSRIRHVLYALDEMATLGDAAREMALHRVGCLPVLRGRQLLGVITRGDLRRAGVEECFLGASRCASCGSRRAVRPHPRWPTVEYCLDCLAEGEAARGG